MKKQWKQVLCVVFTLVLVICLATIAYADDAGEKSEEVVEVVEVIQDAETAEPEADENAVTADSLDTGDKEVGDNNTEEGIADENKQALARKWSGDKIALVTGLVLVAAGLVIAFFGKKKASKKRPEK